METYHKINAPFKRHMEGGRKGKLILGDWARPEFEYLAKNEWEFTEKVDGTNIRIGWAPTTGTVEFGGRSDNAMIPTALLRFLQKNFPAEGFETVFRNEDEPVVLFGEGYGHKIQSGGKYLDHVSFTLFDVKIGPWWLYRDSVNDIASKLNISSVPVLGTGTLQDAIDIVSTGITFNEHGGIVRWGHKGLESRWGNFEAEGIVARPVVPLFNRKGERIITKIKGADFK